MEFLEAYKYTKKYRTSFRLPGMNYILIPKKKDDKDIINIKYHDNLETIEDIQEFIKAAIDLNSDDWKICNSNLEYSFKNLLSFEEALEQLKAGKMLVDLVLLGMIYIYLCCRQLLWLIWIE